MEERAKLLGRCLGDAPAWFRATRLLLTLGLLAGMLLGPARVYAQAPHLAISDLTFSLAGPDNTREYVEIANLGDAAWDPNNHWVLRAADADDTQQLFVRIQGVDPVPPGQVLLLEWGRPISGVVCATKGNIFCTGREDAAGNAFSTDELRPEMALAVFAPTPTNQPPTVAEGNMLAYYFQGDPTNIDRDEYAYDRAVQLKLWKDGDGVSTDGVSDWGVALRMGPGAYPANHGRSAADYYLTTAGFPSLGSANDKDFDLTSPAAPAPNTMNRAGTPARPNYLHPGEPIPGQIAAGFRSVEDAAITASLVTNAPATGLQAAALNTDGAVATSLFSSNAWGPWAVVAGAPAADGLTLLDNPRRASRTLILRARADGALAMSVASGDRDKTFAAPAPMGSLKAQFAPTAAVDPATGNEYYVAVEMGTGALMVAANANGMLGAWQPIAGVTTDAPVAAHWSADPAGLNVVAWNGNQLVLALMGADGKFGAWQNLGAAVSARPAGIGPVLGWNPAAKRLEIIALSGTADKADVQHARVELTAAAEAKASSFTQIAGLTTNAAPAIAIHPDSGQIRLLARGAGHEPGLNPRQGNDPGDPQAGFVLEAIFDGTAWGAPKRVGSDRLPGVSDGTPLFKAPAAPVTLFDAGTQKFRDFLIGEDAQVYDSGLAP